MLPLRFRTLTGRFGLLYAIVLALLISVGGLITVHLKRIGVDSQRLIEEAREQTVAAQLLSEIDALVALLEQPTQIDPAEYDRGRRLLTSTHTELIALEAPPEGDPSRLEHQLAEETLFVDLEHELNAVVLLLAPDLPDLDVTEAKAHLGEAHRLCNALMNKAREEALEANHDLQARVKSSGRTLFATWGLMGLILALAMSLVHYGVVKPIQRLRASTERFGKGDREHRVEIESTDELGDLARSFNSMAERLAQSQDDLEDRVRKRTAEFLRAARLADLGVLASGIAHEINTPLASIATSAEGLQRRINGNGVTPELLKEYTRIIADEAYRARDITTRMLALVRQEPSEVGPVSLNLVLEQAGNALRHKADKRGIQLVPQSLPGDAQARANAGELVQIFINLIGNAIDASPAKGTVHYAAEVENNELLFSVTDHGCGIPKEQLDFIFEPFFTTKSPGMGTGLGLALVATLVESHGGTITVQSEPDVATTFVVRLPLDWSVRA